MPSVGDISRLIQQYSRSNEARAVFRKWTKHTGPDQGACYAIAEAMRMTFGTGQLFGFGVAVGDAVFLYHVYLKIEGTYFDGHGAHSVYDIEDSDLAAYLKQTANQYAKKANQHNIPYSTVGPDGLPHHSLILNPTTTEDVAASTIRTDREFVHEVQLGLHQTLRNLYTRSYGSEYRRPDY